MTKLLFIFLLVWMGKTSCSLEKNIIIGDIAGLEKGDIVYLASGNALQTPRLIKKVTVRTDGEFEIKTRLSDCFVTISVGKDGKKFKPNVRNDYGFFLEGFSTIHLMGEVDYLNYLQISGGLYSLPEMAEINASRENALSAQKEGLDLFNYIQELKNAAKTSKGYTKKKHVAKSIADLQVRAMALIRESSNLFSNQYSLQTKFILNNPHFAFSAELLLSNYPIKTDLLLFEKTFSNFSPHVQKTNAGNLIAQQINAIHKTNVGNIAPDFSALDMNGNTITLSGFKGKHVLLEFWATWCTSCRKTAPRLVSLYSEYGGSNFQIIGVATDEHSEDNWRNVISQDKRNWAHINDTNPLDHEKVQLLYAVMNVPTCFFIGPDGIIIAKGAPVDVIPVIEATLSK